MRNPVVLGVLVVLILVVAGCNPFLDRLSRTSEASAPRSGGSLVRVDSWSGQG
jgi:hypothetical protein